jgi:hypothetical protein
VSSTLSIHGDFLSCGARSWVCEGEDEEALTLQLARGAAWWAVRVKDASRGHRCSLGSRINQGPLRYEQSWAQKIRARPRSPSFLRSPRVWSPLLSSPPAHLSSSWRAAGGAVSPNCPPQTREQSIVVILS